MRITFYLFLVFLMTNCSSSKIISLATQGQVAEKDFNQEIPFYYLENFMYIDVVINKKAYPFLLDTGWDITHIDHSLYEEIEFVPNKKFNVSGSSFETTKLQYGTLVSSLMIGDLDFQNIGVGLQNMSFLKSTFPDKRKVYGIIGTNVLRKAFWQIDYKKQTLKISNKLGDFPPDPAAHKINMIAKSSANWGLNRIKVSINGVIANMVFDTGSYGNFSANPAFLEELEKAEKSLVEISNNSQSGKRKIRIDELKLGPLELKNQELLIEKEIDLLIGNDFLEDYILTIDWENNVLFLSPN